MATQAEVMLRNAKKSLEYAQQTGNTQLAQSAQNAISNLTGIVSSGTQPTASQLSSVSKTAPTPSTSTPATPSTSSGGGSSYTPSTSGGSVMSNAQAAASENYGITSSGERIPIKIVNGLSYNANTGERVPIGTTVQTAGGIYKLTESGGVQVGAHNAQASAGGSGTSFGVTPTGEQIPVKIVNGLSYNANTGERIAVGTTVTTANGDIYKLTENGGVKVSQHNPMTVQAPGLLGVFPAPVPQSQLVQEQQAMMELIKSNYGALRENIKSQIASRLSAAVTAASAEGIGLEAEARKAGEAIDVEKYKNLSALKEVAAARGISSGRERGSAASIMQRAQAEQAGVTQNVMNAKAQIEARISSLRDEAMAQESQQLFELSQAEAQEMLRQMERFGELTREEARYQETKLQQAENLRTTKLNNDMLELEVAANNINLSNLPAERRLALEKAQEDIAAMKRAGQTDAAQLLNANIQIEMAKLALTAAQKDATTKQSIEDAIEIFGNAMGANASTTDLTSWLNQNRGTLERWGIYEQFINAMNAYARGGGGYTKTGLVPQ